MSAHTAPNHFSYSVRKRFPNEIFFSQEEQAADADSKDERATEESTEESNDEEAAEDAEDAEKEEEEEEDEEEEEEDEEEIVDPKETLEEG